MTPGQTVQIPVHITFSPYPWDWAASDTVLNAVLQLLPVLLIAVAALPFARRGASRYSGQRWFWLVTAVAGVIGVVEIVLLYQLTVPVGRISLFEAWLLAAVPLVLSFALLRLALVPVTKGPVSRHNSPVLSESMELVYPRPMGRTRPRSGRRVRQPRR